MSCGALPESNMIEEEYDPQSNVCSNQDDFNHALKSALRHIEKENIKNENSYMFLYLVPWMIFFVWALILALKVPAGPMKTIHVLFAILFSPLYVIATLFGALNDK